MKFRVHMLAATMALAGLCSTLSLPAHALGFGALRVQSDIYQPLMAEVDLRLGDRESLADVSVRQAPVSEYERQGVPFSQALANMRVELKNLGGRPVAVLTTNGPITAAGLQFILQSVSSQGRVLRTFTLQMSTSALSGPTAAQGMRQSGAFTAPMVAAMPLPELPALYKSQPMQPQPMQPQSGSQIASIYSNVIEIGNRPATRLIERVNGAANSEPLSKTLTKIVPSKWKGFAGDAAIKSARQVSWTGDSRVWVSVLDQVMGQSGMTATVDWDRKEVTFRGLDGVAEAKPMPAPAPAVAAAVTAPAAPIAPTRAVAAEVVKQPSPAATPAVAAAPAQTAPTAPTATAAPKGPSLAEQSHEETRQKAILMADELRRSQSAAEAAREAKAAADEKARVAQAAADERARVAKAAADEKVRADQAVADEATRIAKAILAEDERLQNERRAHLRAKAELRVKAQNARIDAEEAERKAKAEAARAAQPAAASGAAPAVAPAASAAPAAAAPAPVVTPASASSTASTSTAPLSTLTLVGDVLSQLHQVNSGGANANLFPVLALIAPPGWTMSTEEKSISQMTGINWSGNGREWLPVLNEVLLANNLKAVVNAKDKRIYLKR